MITAASGFALTVRSTASLCEQPYADSVNRYVTYPGVINELVNVSLMLPTVSDAVAGNIPVIAVLAHVNVVVGVKDSAE